MIAHRLHNELPADSPVPVTGNTDYDNRDQQPVIGMLQGVEDVVFLLIRKIMCNKPD
jgi:hypothetical protein